MRDVKFIFCHVALYFFFFFSQITMIGCEYIYKMCYPSDAFCFHEILYNSYFVREVNDGINLVKKINISIKRSRIYRKKYIIGERERDLELFSLLHSYLAKST
jgi:hypothetical protein